MVDITPVPTQVRRPWRATARTVFQVAIATAAILPLIFAGVPTPGWAASLVAAAGAITRVMALPEVERFLETYLPWLAAKPKVKVPEL